MRRTSTLLLSALVAGSAAAGAIPFGDVGLTPVACAEGDVTPDGRVFPEPFVSVTYLSFAEFECGIALLEERHADQVEVTVLLEDAVTGPGAGEPVYDVVLTDESVPAGQKERLLVMSSIHGDEIGPREGAARQIEDLLTGRNLAGLDVDRLLAEFELHWVFPNPSGWVDGEAFEAGSVERTYDRENHGNTDLNRNFPVRGWFGYQQPNYFTPEGTAVRELLLEGREAELDGESLGWGLGTDNHGQLTDTYLAAGLQIVGQFDFQKSERLATFADRIDREMVNFLSNSPFAGLQAALRDAGFDVAGGYRWGTLYDILGYSASGSGIDYYNTPGEVDGVGFATEVTAGKQLAANRATYSGVLNQVWVDSIRAINMAMFKEALATNDGERDFTFELDGDVAYVLDPVRITDGDADGRGNTVDESNPGGHVLQPYDVSKYDFFADLAPLADAAVDPVPAEEVATADLSGYAAVVLTETEVLDRLGPAGRDAAVDSLLAYADAGGTLVLTDEALRLVERVAPGATATVSARYVGSVDSFEPEGGALNADLRGVASQTFDTVPIGYRFGNNASANSAPNWTVPSAAWEAAGGVTAGTTGGRTIYGEIAVGEGRVRILGALLPDPTEAYYHPFGLQSYAVTYTGYTLLRNMVNAD